MITPPASIKPEETAGYLAETAALLGKGLPVIIDEECDYITRGGLTVSIDRVKSPVNATFCCAGTLYIPKAIPGKFNTEFNIWQPNGRFMALGEHKHDIVRKAE